MARLNPWDDAPHTLTEFGPLSSEIKPAGSFLSRWLRRGKGEDAEHSGSSSRTGSAPSSREGSVERRPPSSQIGGAERISRPASIDGVTAASKPVPIGAVGGGLENSSQSDEGSDGRPGQIGDVRMSHRTLSSVLSRLSNILDRSSTTPQTYKDSDFKQYWMPDSSCKECYDCGDKFTTFRRRHHCRICGQIFCSKCCNQELPGKIIGYKGGIRVCDYCCKVVLRYAQQSVSTGEVKVFRDDIRTMSALQLDSESGSFDFGLWSPLAKRRSLSKEDLTLQHQRFVELQGTDCFNKSAPFDLTPQSEFSSQESFLNETRILTQDSVQLRALWRQIQEADTGVEMQSHRVRLRTHQNCIVGRDLVDWFLRSDKEVKREQAVAIGQALIYAGYIEPIGNQLPIFRDDFTLYKPGESASLVESQTDIQALPPLPEERESSEPLWFREIESDEDTDDRTISLGDDQQSSLTSSYGRKSFSSESENRVLFSLGEKSETNINSMPEIPRSSIMSRDMMEEPLPRQDSSVSGFSDEFLKGALFLSKAPVPSSDIVTCPQGWRVVEQLGEENGEKLAYERLKQAHTEHLQVMTRQLLSQQGLSASWEAVILNCVHQVTHFVRPDVRAEGDDMDVRKYVHIKKIPVGQKQDTSLIHGLVFTKNIAHKKMRQQIANPHILLLRGAVEYQRVENKFSSLEPQILQEREFLKNSVAKIVAFRPNIVVVEKSVSRLAQEFLLDAGITLVFNVKPTVMERLARFTQADIVASIDGLVSKPNLGFCHDFHCQTYTMPNKESKTVVVFGGCATHLGCTINLTGASISELKRVKLILKFMTYVAYNSLLELCFAMDEFAMPPPGSEELAENMEGFESSTEQPDMGEILDEEPMDISEMQEKQDASKQEDKVRGVSFEVGESCAVQSDATAKQDDVEVEYTSLTEMSSSIQESFFDAAETVGDMQAKGEAATETQSETAEPVEKSGANLSVPQVPDPTMKRQLSAVMELTDCSDPLLSYQKNQDDSIFKRSQSIQFQEQKQTMYRQFRNTLHGISLSASPYIKYNVPFLESEAGANCFVRKYLPDEIYWSALFTGEKAPKEQRLSRTKYLDMDYGARFPVKSDIKITEAHPFVLSEMTAAAHENSTQALLADFRARGGRIYMLSGEGKNGVSRDSAKAKKEAVEETLANEYGRTGICWEKKTDCLDVRNHQKLSVLFSSYSYRSPNHPNPCVYPWVVTMEYYDRNDITLGGFLERFCFRESYTCPSPTCEVPMFDHIRRFVHGHGCINVLLKKLENPIPGAQDNILLWSWCRRCKQVTPVVPISADTWNLSFAKYLDLRFHCTSFRRRGCAEPCPHSLHLDHYQYFGHRDIVASFKYANVTLRELALPAVIVDLNPMSLNAHNALMDIKAITNSMIFEISMKLKSEVTGDAALRMMTDYLNEQQSDKSKFREFATCIQVKVTEASDGESVPEADKTLEIMDNLVQLKKMVSDSVHRWNTRLQDFVTNQQRRSRTAKKEKDFASSVDEAEKPLLKTTEDRNPGIFIISSDSPCPSPEDWKLGTVPQSSPSAGQVTASAEPAKEGQNTNKAEEHYLLAPCERVPVIVYDQEPSSIIAYGLSSADYQVKLREIQAMMWGGPKDLSVSVSSNLPTKGNKPADMGNMTVEAMLETGFLFLTIAVFSSVVCPAGRKAGSGVLSFLRGASVTREPSPKLGRKSECIESVRYTPRMDWDSLEGTFTLSPITLQAALLIHVFVPSAFGNPFSRLRISRPTYR
ncbi:hypothetical protein BaRGS_00010226 [Batillaria attramentaria]|uniref:1-phosphatidylinositol-3-phosphate 5-kinase n=1 Tax=Batillaria attramentaria TaxID=370345 RepID=A0ABD0LGD0_9CAEN